MSADSKLQTDCNEVATMENQKIAFVAKKFGVSTQAVYKKLTKLGNQVATELVKENGATWLTPRGVEILEEAFGNKPQVGIATVDNLVATLQKGIDEKQALIISQQETIRQLLEKQAEERTRADTIIMKLSNDLGSVRNILEEARKPIPLLAEPPKPVVVWRPEVVEEPLANLAWYRRAWVRVFEPWRMRRCAS